MLFNFKEHARQKSNLSKPYKGIVVDRNDPKKLGRVKCIVTGLFEDTDNLPWIYPKTSSALGGRNDLGFFAVPELESELEINFPYDDIYFPFYVGYWQSAKTHQGTYDRNYPDSYGHRDSQGTYLLVSLAQKLLEAVHASGASIIVNKEGEVELKVPSKLSMTTEDRETYLNFDALSGDINLNSKGTYSIGGYKTSINSSIFEVKSPTLNESIGGAKNSKVVGGLSQTIGGSSTEAVTLNKSMVIGNNYSELVAGLTDRTYGLGIVENIAAGGYTRTILVGGITETLAAGAYTISSLTCTFNTATAFTVNALASTSFTTPSFTITSPLTTITGQVLVAGGASGVLTQLANPVVDLITGAPHVGSVSLLSS
jgi:hypothetical protein